MLLFLFLNISLLQIQLFDAAAQNKRTGDSIVLRFFLLLRVFRAALFFLISYTVECLNIRVLIKAIMHLI